MAYINIFDLPFTPQGCGTFYLATHQLRNIFFILNIMNNVVAFVCKHCAGLCCDSVDSAKPCAFSSHLGKKENEFPAMKEILLLVKFPVL